MSLIKPEWKNKIEEYFFFEFFFEIMLLVKLIYFDGD